MKINCISLIRMTKKGLGNMAKKKRLHSFLVIFLASVSSFSISSCSEAAVANKNELSLLLNYDWKGSVSLGIESDKDINELEEISKKYIDGFNSISGDNDFVTYKSLTKNNEDVYSLNASLRRIDKIKGTGDFDVSSLSNFSIIDTDRYNLLKRLASGTWSYKSSASFEGDRGQVSIDRMANGIRPISFNSFNGNEIDDIESFLQNEGMNSSDNKKVFVFRFVGLDETIGNIKKINISLPGKITHYAGNDIEIVDEKTISLSTSYVNCSLIKQNSETLISKDCLCAYGFVIVDQPISPVSLGFIIAGSIVFVGLLVALFLYFYFRGKKYYQRINEYGNK